MNDFGQTLTARSHYFEVNMDKKSFGLSMEKGDLLPTILIMPTLLIVLCFTIVPMFYGIYVSLHEYRLGGGLSSENFVGLSNYVNAFKDSTTKKAIVNTVIFAVGCVAGDLVFGTIISVLLYRLKEGVQHILRPFMIMPLLVAPIVTSLMWTSLLDVNGVIYWALGKIGITYAQFKGVSGTSTALFCCITAHWWTNIPFVVIVLSAGLLCISEDLYEAAYCDGVGLMKTFWYITLPLLKSVYMTIILISGVDTIKSMDVVFGLTKGGPNNSSMTLNLYSYLQAFESGNMSYAMTLSVLTLILALACFGIPFVRYNNNKCNS